MLGEVSGAGFQTCCWNALPRVEVAGPAGVLQLKGARIIVKVNNAGGFES